MWTWFKKTNGVLFKFLNQKLHSKLRGMQLLVAEKKASHIPSSVYYCSTQKYLLCQFYEDPRTTHQGDFKMDLMSCTRRPLYCSGRRGPLRAWMWIDVLLAGKVDVAYRLKQTCVLSVYFQGHRYWGSPRACYTSRTSIHGFPLCPAFMVFLLLNIYTAVPIASVYYSLNPF